MQKATKIDRRIKYTKMVLKESFIALLRKKAITKISIKEICEAADINRTTFYAHYSSQYDLLREIQNELTTEIISYLNKYKLTKDGAVSIELLEAIFEYIKENSEICTLFLMGTADIGDWATYDGRVDTNFENHIIKLVREWCTGFWESSGMSTRVDVEYTYTFSAYGCLGVIKKWLAEGTKKSTKEMADLVVKMTAYGLGQHEEIKETI